MKFDDYFSFPRVLDMAPYTAEGRAEVESRYYTYLLDGDSIYLDFLVAKLLYRYLCLYVCLSVRFRGKRDFGP